MVARIVAVPRVRHLVRSLLQRRPFISGPVARLKCILQDFLCFFAALAGFVLVGIMTFVKPGTSMRTFVLKLGGSLPPSFRVGFSETRDRDSRHRSPGRTR